MICCVVLSIEAHEVFEVNHIYDGYRFVQQTIEPNCTWDHSPYNRGSLNWYLVCVSYMEFGNSQAIPFGISIVLLPVSFLFARRYAGNLVGLMVMSGLALNPAFLIFDSAAAYSQTWALLFLASFYFIGKSPIVSAVTFNLSLFSKAIPMVWAPFVIYGIFRSGITPRKKYVLYVGIGVPFLVLGSLSAFDGGSMVYGYIPLKPVSLNSFVEAIQWTWDAFRWNEEILLATPVVFGLYFWKRKSWALPSLPFQLLAVSMVTFFGISLLTTEGYFPYRIIPNLVMFLFAASTLLERGLLKKLKL